MGVWSGDDWQAYCDGLLIARYGADYQRIPDELGDLGAEGFVDDALVQAYAAEEVFDGKKLYESQRDKITRDLGKIRKNCDSLRGMVGRPIGRVIFLMPEVRTKELLLHAAEKAKQLREAQLAQFSDDFDIRVLTADDFPEERRKLGENLGMNLNLVPDDVADDDVESWASGNSELADNLNRKLQGLDDLTDARRVELGGVLLRMYLRRADVLRQLREFYPKVWESLHNEISAREQSLAAENVLHSGPGVQRIIDLVAEVEGRLVEGVPGMRANGIDVGWGTVADWLLRCPLELNGAVT